MIRVRKHREIYLLPNFLTIVNISLGYFSILALFNGNYARAAFWIVLAAVIDGVDGIVARATKTQSAFGIQLDSFADAFSFGAAPSLLVYFWGFKQVSPSGLGVFFSFIFIAAAVLRLARYNIIQMKIKDRKYYTGLTVPSASMLLAAIILLHPQPIRGRMYSFLLAFLVIGLSLCMISTLKYRNLLNFNFRHRIDIRVALLIAIISSSLLIFPKYFLLFYFSANVLSGPTVYIFNLVKKTVEKRLIHKKAIIPKIRE